MVPPEVVELGICDGDEFPPSDSLAIEVGTVAEVELAGGDTTESGWLVLADELEGTDVGPALMEVPSDVIVAILELSDIEADDAELGSGAAVSVLEAVADDAEGTAVEHEALLESSTVLEGTLVEEVGDEAVDELGSALCVLGGTDEAVEELAVDLVTLIDCDGRLVEAVELSVCVGTEDELGSAVRVLAEAVDEAVLEDVTGPDVTVILLRGRRSLRMCRMKTY